METKVNVISETRNEVEVILTYEEIIPDIEKEYKEHQKKINLPGFRKGKAPLQMIKKMYGTAIEYEASEKIANARFWKIVKEKELKPLGEPTLIDINFEPGQNLSFKVQFDVLPKFEPVNYTGLEVDIPDYKVNDDDVEKEIKNILKTNGTKEIADFVEDEFTVIKTDITRIDENGMAIIGSSSNDMSIDLSDPKVNPQFADNAKGKKVDEKFTVSLHNHRHAKNDKGEDEVIHEDLQYEVHIKEIEKIVLPELNEELIKKLTKDRLTSVEELRKEISTSIQQYYDNSMDDYLKGKFSTLIVQNNPFAPPQFMVTNTVDKMLEDEEKEAKRVKRPFNKNEAKEYFTPLAEKTVQWYLLKDLIAKKENISVNEDDLNALAEKEAEKTGLPFEKVLNYYKTSHYDDKLLDDKVFEFLKANNKLTKVAPEKLFKKDHDHE